MASRWTGKEYSYAASKQLPIYIVADIDYDEILELLPYLQSHKAADHSALGRCSSASGEFIRAIIEDRESIVQTFVYSRNNTEQNLPAETSPYTDLPSAIQSRRRSS